MSDIFDDAISRSNRLVIVYGLNDSGKSQLLKSKIKKIYQTNKLRILSEQNELLNFIFIPTSRLETSPLVESTTYSNIQTSNKYEMIENFIQDVNGYEDLRIHNMRKHVLTNPKNKSIISSAISSIFSISVDLDDNISKFSDGIENIINIYCWILFADEIYNYELKKKERLHVFIDEVELFLHIKIQKNILAKIMSDFKHIKLVVTTHSPIIIQNIKNDQIILKMENRVVTLVEDYSKYFHSLDDVTSELFEVSTYPDEIVKYFSYASDLSNRKIDFSEKNIKKFLLDATKLVTDYPSFSSKIINVQLDVLECLNIE